MFFSEIFAFFSYCFWVIVFLVIMPVIGYYSFKIIFKIIPVLGSDDDLTPNPDVSMKKCPYCGLSDAEAKRMNIGGFPNYKKGYNPRIGRLSVIQVCEWCGCPKQDD